MTPSTVVGRLAPSPTGDLHLGHARSFLLAWWSCRAQGGKLILRFEDLDAARSQAQFFDSAREDLEWLGMDWDEEQVQSQQLERILDAANSLLDAGLAYPCVCSRGDIRAALSAPHGPTQELYPGTCRDRFSTLEQAERDTSKPAGLRFKTDSTPLQFIDGIQGAVQQRLAESCGDFLILRRDKTPAYQLSVVVDDGMDGITEVVRGEDLLESTPRQLALFSALGFKAPRYFHVPLVNDAAGERLAKRSAALSLKSLRAQQVDPQAVVEWAARSAGLPITTRCTAAQVLGNFDWRHIHATSVRVTQNVLDELRRR